MSLPTLGQYIQDNSFAGRVLSQLHRRDLADRLDALDAEVQQAMVEHGEKSGQVGYLKFHFERAWRRFVGASI